MRVLSSKRYRCEDRVLLVWDSRTLVHYNSMVLLYSNSGTLVVLVGGRELVGGRGEDGVYFSTVR